MKDQGVTLIELLVVIAIVGILVVALGFSYVGWQGRYKVEKATKDIYSDLMTARSMAMTRNRFYFADFNFPAPPAGKGTYRIAEDANDDSAGDADANGEIDAAGHTFLPSFPKTVDYAISSDAGGIITFDKRGIISSPSLLPPVTEVVVCITAGSDAAPDYDCIEISQTRLTIGKLTKQISNGGACNEANCEAK